MPRESPAQLAINQSISHPLTLLAGEGDHEQNSQLPSTKISMKSASVFEASEIYAGLDLRLAEHNEEHKPEYLESGKIETVPAVVVRQ